MSKNKVLKLFNEIENNKKNGKVIKTIAATFQIQSALAELYNTRSVIITLNDEIEFFKKNGFQLNKYNEISWIITI